MLRPLLLIATLALAACQHTERAIEAPATMRVATYNASLFDEADGGLVRRLAGDDERARRIAAVIQTVRPDLLLLNEFDYDAGGEAADRFQREYLGVGQHGREPIAYAHRWIAPVNTGVPSGLDLDGDGRTDGPADAWGFGRHPGQYGMLVLSRFPIARERVRSFREFRWADLPGALRPVRADGSTYYDDATWSKLRLSSKSHWDVPVATPLGEIHFLVAHPTPPVFDGPEDRNGRRNHDEIRIWADYVAGDPARVAYLYDDAGGREPLPADARFVIAGDLNADPVDGASWPGAIARLLDSPRVRATPVPASAGAVEASRSGGANATHRGNPAHDTGKFGAAAGNMRIDYVLGSTNLRILDSGVFWPPAADPDAALIDASDHRMVWLDVSL